MTDEPYIKRELESPTPKRQRLSVSNAQDMFDLMHQYSPPPHHPVGGSQQHTTGSPSNHHRRRPNYNRWERGNPAGVGPRSPAPRRSPFPSNNHYLRRSPHHQNHQGLRRSNRHRNQWHQNNQDPEVRSRTRISQLMINSWCLDIFLVRVDKPHKRHCLMRLRLCKAYLSV